ncbi:MAG: hypothetical protein LC796_15405 [Acidobacteria bacterium]|nr:hypothetical protein [Acidobacteriota bacterium]MCA1610429.1 hypothetical protein [Acidobacteriota bacterium]
MKVPISSRYSESLKGRPGTAPRSIPRRARAEPRSFAIGLTRLAKVDESPGLILLTVGESTGTAPKKIGLLTDAALRGRLAHFDAHSANEIAAIRRALLLESGHTTIFETWSNLPGCLGFWSGFMGLQIRRIEWTCEGCGVPAFESIGGSVGELFPVLCRCGVKTRVTVPKYATEIDLVTRR